MKGLPSLLLAVGLSLDCSPDPEAPVPSGAAEFVGSAQCVGCHEGEYAAWVGSHHDRAMEEASAETVLGDFDTTEVTRLGVTTRFTRRDGGYYVRTESETGTLEEYRIAYTFGVDPLQQYLIRFPGGRLQPLGIAWDARPTEAGGQRWFLLNPERRIPPDDALHWTGRRQNWNRMCAECHSTGLRRRYDAVSDRYDTRWAELDVACEACHGPASRHMADANEPLPVRLVGESRAWRFLPGQPIARRNAERVDFSEQEACARCHSLRSPITRHFEHGQRFDDAYRLAIPDDRYYPDGQIKSEVYVYGSFLQSKMFRAGVTCSDCHDPHSLALRAEGNDLCATCHQPAQFDTVDHHFHPGESAGSRCVACHMPATTYMVIDTRHDHGFRVPDPARSVDSDIPNACDRCHGDRGDVWAAELLEARGVSRKSAPLPPILVAAALERGETPGGDFSAALERALRADSPLVRRAAVAVAGRLPAASGHVLAPLQLLDDPLRTVRMEAAFAAAGIPRSALPRGRLTALERRQFDRAVGEYEKAQRSNADTPEAHTNLGNLYRRLQTNGWRDAVPSPEAEYRTALRLDALFSPAVVNLADLYRAENREAAGLAVLREALSRDPERPELQFATGLALVRNGENALALEALARAAELAPEQSRYVYVWAVALHGAGEIERAIGVLAGLAERDPRDPEMWIALVTFARGAGHAADAKRYADAFLEAFPDEPVAQQLVDRPVRP